MKRGALAALLVLAACGGGGAEAARPRTPAVRLSGSILGSGGPPCEQWFCAYPLPALRPASFDLGRNGEDRFGGYWLDADHALTFINEPDGVSSHLVKASLSGPPKRIGPAVMYAEGFEYRNGIALTTTCFDDSGFGQQHPHGSVPLPTFVNEAILVLDLDHPSAWRRVGGSCRATLSPDGRRVAFVRNRKEIWEGPTTGGRPNLRVDLATVPAIRRLPARWRNVIALAWGEGGVAALLGSEEGGGIEHRVIVVIDHSGRARAVPLAAGNMNLPSRPWQPKGPLLAFISMPTSGGGVVRLFDPRTGKLWVVATDPGWFGDLLWSPDGRSLVVTTSSSAMLFVDTAGRWVRRVGIGEVGMLDWRD